MYLATSSKMKKFLLILGLSVFVVAMDSCKKPPLPIITDTDSTGGGSGSGGGSGGGSPFESFLEEEEEVVVLVNL